MKSRISFNRSFEGVRPELWVCLYLLAAIMVIYQPVGGYEFINYDDPLYVTENEPVRRGLTLEGTRWAFTSMHAANWHPITWLSHMLDVQLYGLNAGAHHLTNVLFHIFNSMLLFLLLQRMTGALWRSAMVAALFAVHPLYVESVAWISERKDVLSTFFGFLTLLAYAEYIKRPGLLRYALALLLFALGLMSKPMVVTLPFLMLVLDCWPLNRYAEEGSVRRFVVLLKEKLPFFVLSAASCVVTIIAQGRIGAVVSLESYSFGVRLANALTAYTEYLGKMIWPSNLAVLYPHPGVRQMWQVITAVILISGISAAAFLWARRRPWFGVAWFWYLGTLVPVIGLIQVGSQAMADRYAYIPLIGIYTALVWGFHDLLHRWHKPRLAFVSLAVLPALMLVAGNQVRYWQNSITLYAHTLEVTEANGLIHNNLGLALASIGKTSEAIDHYSEAIRINPKDSAAYYNKGIAIVLHNNLGELFSDYFRAIEIDPAQDMDLNIQKVLSTQDAIEKAHKHFETALNISSEHTTGSLNNMGALLICQGRIEPAISHFQKSADIDQNAAALNNLKLAIHARVKIDENISELQRLLQTQNYSEIRYKLGNLYMRSGQFQKAITQYETVFELQPCGKKNLMALAAVNALDGHYDVSISWLEKLIALEPENAKYDADIACLYSAKKNKQETFY